MPKIKYNIKEGDIYGEFTILEKIKVRQNNGVERTEVVFKCSCGKMLKCPPAVFFRRKVFKCAKCWRNSDGVSECKIKYRNGEAFKNNFYSAYRYKALERKIDFFLTKLEFNILINRACFYCGLESSLNIAKSKGANSKYKKDYICLVNGIDRIDPKKGYYIANCVSCCKRCNIIKCNQSIDSFLSDVDEIYLNRGKNED